MSAFLSLISPTSFLLAMVVVLSISNAVFINLYSGAKDELVTYQAQVELVNAQIAADNEHKIRRSEQITAEVKSDLADALASLRKRPAVRVLQSKCDTGAGQAVSLASSVPLATPVADAVDTGIVLTAEACAEKLGDGIEDAVRLSWLQHWIVSQHEAQK